MDIPIAGGNSKKNTGRFQLEGNFPMTAGNSRVMSAWTDVHMLITADLIDQKVFLEVFQLQVGHPVQELSTHFSREIHHYCTALDG